MTDRFDMPSAFVRAAGGKLNSKLWPRLAEQGWQLVAVIAPNKVRLGRNTMTDRVIYDVVECTPDLYSRFAKQLEKRAKAEEYLMAWVQKRERERRQWREYYHRKQAAKRAQNGRFGTDFAV